MEHNSNCIDDTSQMYRVDMSADVAASIMDQLGNASKELAGIPLFAPAVPYLGIANSTLGTVSNLVRQLTSPYKALIPERVNISLDPTGVHSKSMLAGRYVLIP